jgi:hypothetical protein
MSLPQVFSFPIDEAVDSGCFGVCHCTLRAILLGSKQGRKATILTSYGFEGLTSVLIHGEGNQVSQTL